jgi:outer membrane translocation and assembly module TamA
LPHPAGIRKHGHHASSVRKRVFSFGTHKLYLYISQILSSKNFVLSMPYLGKKKGKVIPVTGRERP